MLTFVGSYSRAVDGKGRTPVPHKWRRMIESDSEGDGTLVLTVDQDPTRTAVRAQTSDGYALTINRLAQAQLSPQAERVARRLRASAEVCEVDGTGRILIPNTMRKHLGITGEVMWVAQGHYLELLSPREFEAQQELAPEEQAAGAEELRQLLNY